MSGQKETDRVKKCSLSLAKNVEQDVQVRSDKGRKLKRAIDAGTVACFAKRRFDQGAVSQS